MGAETFLPSVAEASVQREQQPKWIFTSISWQRGRFSGGIRCFLYQHGSSSLFEIGLERFGMNGLVGVKRFLSLRTAHKAE